MKGWLVILALVTAGAVGCGEADRKWMKLSGNYTTEDLRRDLFACTRDKVLSDKCMEDRGWLALNPGKEDVKNARNQDQERGDRTSKGRY